MRGIITTTETIPGGLDLPVLVENSLLDDGDICRIKAWLISDL